MERIPHNYGKWGTVHQRFIRWQRKGIWKKLFDRFNGNKKFEWLMTDANYIKNYQYSYCAREGNKVISMAK